MILLISSAWAYESPDVEFVLEDEVNLFEEIAFDSGWLPSSSPVAIKFELVAEGGSLVEMEGLSWAYWPVAITHGYTPVAESGLFLLDSEIGVQVSYKIDWSGFYYEAPIWTETSVFEGEAFFDPFLLEGDDPRWTEIESEGEQQELVRFEQDVITGVSLYVAVDWRNDAYAAFSGVQFLTNESIIDTADGIEIFDAPGAPELELDTTFTGLYLAALDVVMVPTFGICIDTIGCFDVASFDVPIPLVDKELSRDFETVRIEHPLPVLVVETRDCDFGEVELGQIATCEIEILNWGELTLEGGAGILGAGEFSVFPEDIYASEDLGDGLTVTFEPTVVGVQEASLILNTSDPNDPAYEIPLVGEGIVIEPEIVTIPSEVGTCGCGTRPTPLGILPMLGAVFAVVVRRRQEPSGSTPSGSIRT